MRTRRRAEFTAFHSYNENVDKAKQGRSVFALISQFYERFRVTILFNVLRVTTTMVSIKRIVVNTNALLEKFPFPRECNLKQSLLWELFRATFNYKM